MVDRQIAARGVKDAAVLDAMRAVPREAFVANDLARHAYGDTALPIGHDQTISQPYIVALMLAAAALGPADRVLEVGAGSGYAAAVMARIAAKVFAIERIPQLGRSAEERWRALGIDNIALRIGDGSTGWPEEAPFDAILVAAGAPVVPDALRDQLAIGGRLVIPVSAGADHQQMRLIVRRGPDRFEAEDRGAVRFVPLIGREGFGADES
jgi:protein-L-isoaspartate(D-aspartate) O-methyltransferase